MSEKWIAEIVRWAERIALILMSGSVIWRLVPAFSLHPQIVLLLASELAAVFFLLIQRRGTWSSTFYTKLFKYSSGYKCCRSDGCRSYSSWLWFFI